jgi:hypothetical protein
MRALLRRVWLFAAAALGGCLPLRDEPLQTVKPGEFKVPASFKAPGPPPSSGSKEQMMRVNQVGEKLVRANRDIGIRPVPLVVGVPTPELFHKGTDVLYITEGMASRCRTEGQLAAALAFEMGRMVAERESLAVPEVRKPDRLPPMESRVGTDSGGPFGPPDGTRLVELVRYEKDRGKQGAVPPPPPDPMVLARGYLERAGYSAKELDSVASLLRESRGSDAYERQLVGGQLNRPWVP